MWEAVVYFIDCIVYIGEGFWNVWFLLPSMIFIKFFALISQSKQIRTLLFYSFIFTIAAVSTAVVARLIYVFIEEWDPYVIDYYINPSPTPPYFIFSFIIYWFLLSTFEFLILFISFRKKFESSIYITYGINASLFFVFFIVFIIMAIIALVRYG